MLANAYDLSVAMAHWGSAIALSILSLITYRCLFILCGGHCVTLLRAVSMHSKISGLATVGMVSIQQ